MQATRSHFHIATVLILGAFLTLGPAAKPESLTPPPPIDQGTPAKAPQPDRKGGQGAAAALAAAAAGMQMMSCMMMMNEARKMPPGSEKTMMMMMAMQQCAQAAQTAANAAKNNEGKDKLAQAEPAKAPSMSNNPFQTPETKKDDTTAKAAESPSSSPESTPEPSESAVAEVPEFKAPEASPSASTVADAGVAGEAFNPTTSVPNRIDRAKLGYDESGKSGAGATPERALGGGTSVATSKPPDGGSIKGGDAKIEFAPNNTEPGGRKGKGTSEEPSSGSGESAGTTNGGTAEGAGNPMDAMMALLGGGAAPGAEGPKLGGDVLTLEGEANEKPGPNIFEFATYRFRKAAFEESRVKPRPAKQRSASTEPSFGTTFAVARP